MARTSMTLPLSIWRSGCSMFRVAVLGNGLSISESTVFKEEQLVDSSLVGIAFARR